jgi:hypothetical protein
MEGVLHQNRARQLRDRPVEDILLRHLAAGCRRSPRFLALGLMQRQLLV